MASQVNVTKIHSNFKLLTDSFVWIKKVVTMENDYR